MIVEPETEDNLIGSAVMAIPNQKKVLGNLDIKQTQETCWRLRENRKALVVLFI
jgi:hypothetical protein